MNFTNLIKEFNEKGFVIKKFDDQNILKESNLIHGVENFLKRCKKKKFQWLFVQINKNI